MITVTIPVGPDPTYLEYLEECIYSIDRQTFPASEILIIDDQAGLNPDHWQNGIVVRIWKTPWLSGPAHAFNYGVALAKNPLVFMLGSDDYLEPWCLEDCMTAWEKYQDPLGYYWTDVKYSTGEEQRLPCNAAMVHKGLWEATGGFPVASAVGAMDHIFISMMMHKKPGNLYQVESEQPPYYYRVHERTFTNQNKAYHPAVAIVRDHFTEHWEAPTWPKL